VLPKPYAAIRLTQAVRAALDAKGVQPSAAVSVNAVSEVEAETEPGERQGA